MSEIFRRSKWQRKKARRARKRCAAVALEIQQANAVAANKLNKLKEVKMGKGKMKGKGCC